MISTLTRDLLMNMLLGLVALVVITLASVNPKAEEVTSASPQAGNMVASIAWPQGAIDVDMWLSSPQDKAVGYSNKSGKVWSLLRDDLGTANDPTPLNYESAFTRGIPDGEYAVNVRCFGCAGHVPVPVSVEIRLATGELIWKGIVELVADKQERTALRWSMRDGRVVTGSASHVFKEMRG